MSPPAAATKDPASPQPASKPTLSSVAHSTNSTSPEPPKARSDKPSSSTRAEKDVLAASQEKVDGGDGGGKGKQKEDIKRKASQEGEGSRTQRKKKKLERKWELEVVSRPRRS